MIARHISIHCLRLRCTVGCLLQAEPQTETFLCFALSVPLAMSVMADISITTRSLLEAVVPQHIKSDALFICGAASASASMSRAVAWRYLPFTLAVT